ncbi:hypothetical protein CLI79_06370 [Porphyromonas gingivalis]|nr:hypothetical protein CLI79_06370 [Porphyromonas gingivalis]
MWQIAAATGWSVHYIMWKLNYQTLRMMLADAPRYLSEQERKARNKQKKTLEGFFQTRYRNGNKTR